MTITDYISNSVPSPVVKTLLKHQRQSHAAEIYLGMVLEATNSEYTTVVLTRQTEQTLQAALRNAKLVTTCLTNALMELGVSEQILYHADEKSQNKEETEIKEGQEDSQIPFDFIKDIPPA